ncbi:MAG: transposase [Sedimentisphaerales bacterium]|nr:transposase [Sedimentisphaerales bacterium]
MKTTESVKDLKKAITVNEEHIQSHLDTMIRTTVEETLNRMLEEEADRLCNARRYEHTERRKDSRAGYYNRQLHTKAGQVQLKVPKLRKTTFETAIIERYRRREASVEEALIEMYLAGVSVRRVEDITQALWGTRVSPGTVSELNKKIYAQIATWRNRPIVGRYRRRFPGIRLRGSSSRPRWPRPPPHWTGSALRLKACKPNTIARSLSCPSSKILPNRSLPGSSSFARDSWNWPRVWR